MKWSKTLSYEFSRRVQYATAFYRSLVGAMSTSPGIYAARIICGIVVFVLSLSGQLTAQMNVEGIITEKATGEPIISARITAYSLADDQYISSGFTDLDGRYHLVIEDPKAVRIEVTALFFSGASLKLQPSPTIITANFNLAAKEIMLQQVAIKAKRPKSRSSDTTVYDAAYYARGNEVLAEDLLRSIPGVSVDQAGKISVKGREVEKVMIDNDDFFEKGYRTLTKSLRASLIEQVEILDHYSHQSQLKGIENSNRVALNLRLNEEAKGKTFGNLELTADANNLKTGAAQLNLINLKGKRKSYFSLQANNISEDPMESVERLWQTTSVTENSLINYQRTLTPVTDLGLSTPDFRFNRTVFNNLQTASLSNIFRLGKKIKITPVIAGILNDNSAEIDFTDFFQIDSLAPISNQRQQAFVRADKQLMGKIDVEANLNDRELITSKTIFRTGDRQTANHLILNDIPLFETSWNNRKSVVNRTTYLKKISPQSALLTTLYAGTEQLPESYLLNQNDATIIPALFDTLSSYLQEGWSQKKHFHLESQLILGKPDNKEHKFELLGGVNLERYEFDVNHFPFSASSSRSQTIRPNTSITRLAYRDYYFSGVQSGKIFSLNYRAKAGLHFFESTGQQFNERLSTLSKPIPLGSINLKFQFGVKDNFEFNANRYFSVPTLTEFSSRTLSVNNNLRQTGTGNPTPLLSSQLSLTHNHGHFSDLFNVLTNVSFRVDHQYLSSQTNILGSSVHRQIRRFEGRQSYQLSSTASRYFPQLRNNLKATIGLTHSKYEDALGTGSNIRAISSTNSSLTLELRSTFSSFFNYHLGMVMNRSSYQGDAAISFLENRLFSDLDFRMSKRLFGTFSAETIQFGSPKGTLNQMWFLDGKARYTNKSKKVTYTLTLKNLLNSRRFVTATGSEIALTEINYRLVPRQILLGLNIIL